jgi:hypothetical protein
MILGPSGRQNCSVEYQLPGEYGKCSSGTSEKAATVAPIPQFASCSFAYQLPSLQPSLVEYQLYIGGASYIFKV